MKINEQEKETLIGLGAVTGNDKKIRKQRKRKFWKKIYQEFSLRNL